VADNFDMVQGNSRAEFTGYRCLQLDRLCLWELSVPLAASVQESSTQQQQQKLQQQQQLHAQPQQQQGHAQKQDQLWSDLVAGMVSSAAVQALLIHCSCAALSNNTTSLIGAFTSNCAVVSSCGLVLFKPAATAKGCCCGHICIQQVHGQVSLPFDAHSSSSASLSSHSVTPEKFKNHSVMLCVHCKFR
jgi:hypothetical protein